ncbi:uncharacterized protein PV07_06918 [Cladophialophora immunda]|uniref:Uncharacterized protein n=1 Tax=Cladophialophora immunda TaxID=569365 RepID=A0A0D2APV5_9EURO|nr:uncharacterized protein PV07_06918 [Cladophialophora immunda]KIW27152.1 hypothetical protein PV07_06918 [Cladophialophora immunda]
MLSSGLAGQTVPSARMQDLLRCPSCLPPGCPPFSRPGSIKCSRQCCGGLVSGCQISLCLWIDFLRSVTHGWLRETRHPQIYHPERTYTAQSLVECRCYNDFTWHYLTTAA